MGQIGKNILVVGTMDTKHEEALYLKGLIDKRGHKTLIMDVGTGGAVPFRPDFSREQVALETGRSLEDIKKNVRNYSDMLAAMATGARGIIQRGITEGKIDAVLCIGRGLGTTQATMIIPALPLRIPKLVLSTVAFVPGAFNPEMVSIDQAMIQTPSDLWGLNRMVIAFVMPGIQQDFNLNYTQVGAIISVFGFAWAIGTWAMGSLSDYMGRRLVIVILMIFGGICSWVTGIGELVGGGIADRFGLSASLYLTGFILIGAGILSFFLKETLVKKDVVRRGLEDRLSGQRA